jgi:hypothetical protein
MATGADGVCGLLIAQAAREPINRQRASARAGAGRPDRQRIKQWTFYRRDETRCAVKKALGSL